MSGTLTEIMAGLAGLIATAGLAENVYDWPPDSITVPCAIVAYPTGIDFDLTFDRGGDTYELPVFFVVGRTGTRDARNALSVRITGAASLKETLDGAQTFGDVRCTDAVIEELTVSGVSYLSLKVNVEVL